MTQFKSWPRFIVFSMVLASFAIASCKQRSEAHQNRLKSSSPEQRSEESIIDRDFQVFVEMWGAKDQCVTAIPANTDNFIDFVSNRGRRWQGFCQGYRDAIAAGKKLKDVCAQKIDLVCGGAADGDCSKIGNCGEWSLVGSCESIRRGFSPDKGVVCQTDNDHVFVMLPEPKGTYCLLDRWNVPKERNRSPFAAGTILCNTQIVSGSVVVGETVYQHPWYSDLKCATMTEHFASLCGE